MVDAVVVVTRYSGGIKLGVGGLSRAYASAAKGKSESEWEWLSRSCRVGD